MNDYLGKPYNAEKLLSKLKKWIKQTTLAEVTPSADISDVILLASGIVNEPAIKAGIDVQMAPIDLTFLNDLTGGIVSEMKEMMEAILQVQQEFIDAMDQWLLHKEMALLSASAHKLKGCLYLVGLDYLREHLQQLELQSKDIQMEGEVALLCLKLKPVFVASKNELEVHLSRLAR
jgi:HPt (histidine-containing phosphotransfer) domain-containing protein